jgi:hypothetical protein
MHNVSIITYHPALKHKKFISVYLANRSSTSVTASYKLSLRNQNSNVDVDLFESSGVKTFEGEAGQNIQRTNTHITTRYY